MFKMLLLCSLFLLLMAAGSLFGQTCGDVNDDETTNILDLVRIMDYIAFEEAQPPFIEENADCDGIAGITISDVVRHANYLFHGGMLDCEDTGTYTFHISTDDTVFFPSMLFIPDGINSVSLPVITSFQEDVEGVYFPYHYYMLDTDTLFEYSSTTFYESTLLAERTLEADTGLLYGAHLYAEFPSGQLEFAYLNYTRTGPGEGMIAPELVDRNSLWRVCIERNNELYIPVIKYYSVPLPPDTLYIADTSLSFSIMAGNNPIDSFVMEITSSGNPVSFNLQTTEDWITLGDFPVSGSVTPDNAIIKIDSDELVEGEYFGQIEVVDVDAEVIVPISTIDVYLSVTAPIIYPGGDLNCDGLVNVIDVWILINYLFKGGPEPINCP